MNNIGAVSPMARDIDSIIPVNIPGNALGRTWWRTVCHLVEPTPSAACLKLSGIAIRIDGNIEAIAVYERINKDTAVVHYEKGSPDYDGIYKAVNQETAKILQKNFKTEY